MQFKTDINTFNVYKNLLENLYDKKKYRTSLVQKPICIEKVFINTEILYITDRISGETISTIEPQFELNSVNKIGDYYFIIIDVKLIPVINKISKLVLSN